MPVVPDDVGPSALAVMPAFRQLFVGDPAGATGIELDRKLYCVRKRIEHEVTGSNGERVVYFPSLSCRTLVYKGMLTTASSASFFPDLGDERVESALALVHSRFSTNTFPSWPLAHPYRYLAHNGEINTVQGNRNWMRAREALLASDLIPGDLERIFPICTPGGSRHGQLRRGARAAPPRRPQPAPRRADDDPGGVGAPRDDGPGQAGLLPVPRLAHGAVGRPGVDRLHRRHRHRRGARPQRPASQPLLGHRRRPRDHGVGGRRRRHPRPQVVHKGRLQPGRMFLVDTAQGRIVDDEEIKATLAAEHPYEEWLHAGVVELADLPEREHVVYSHESVLRRQQVFGYTHEELKIILAPMAKTGAEPIGSMGTDTPIAVLSDRPRLLFDYFSQLFAQVTNPPLDAIREELVTALGATIGPEHNLLDPGPASCRQVVLPFPIIDNDELAKIVHVNDDGDMPGFQAVTDQRPVPRRPAAAWPCAGPSTPSASRSARPSPTAPASSCCPTATATRCTRPSRRCCSRRRVHHHLIREKTRTQVGLVVECGDAREVHHMALLLGYGAGAINPYLAFESIEDMIAEGINGLGGLDAHRRPCTTTSRPPARAC